MRTVIVLLFAVITVCRAQLTVNTPASALTCQDTLLTWSGGAADDSYIVQIAASPSGNTIAGFTGITATSYNWLVTVPANTQIFIRILTITRKTGQSGVFTVQAGSDQTCTGTSVAPPIVVSTPPTSPPVISTTPDPGQASTTPPNTPTTDSTDSSTSSTSPLSSGSTSTTSGILTSQGTSLLSHTGTSTGTPSGQTGVSGSSLGDSNSQSSSPNVGLIAGAAAGGGAAALLLLLLGICLYRRNRSAKLEEEEQFHPVDHPTETKVEEPPLPFNPYYPTHSNYSSTTPMVTSYPSVNSHESSALMSQSLHSEPRIMAGGTAFPYMTPIHNTAIASATPGPNSPIATPNQNTAILPAAATTTTTAASYNPAVPVPPTAAATSYNPVIIPGAIPGPMEDSPPMYRDEDEAQIHSQRIRAEEAERARRYDALIADFCASNRDLISPALERKLHAARYLPEDNPSDVAAEYWHTTYGVEFFELRRLQTAYERHVATQALINMPEKALPKAARSSKEKSMYPPRQDGPP